MFLGRYEHTIDEKGRLTIPVRYRDLLEGGAFVTQGFDRSLMVLAPASFEHMVDYINQISMTNPEARQLKRLLFSTAERVEVDRAGRILIPQYLREFAQLEGQAILVGAGDYFEIWSPAEWAHQNEVLQNTEANENRFAAFNLPTR
jgi:MraZ protein